MLEEFILLKQFILNAPASQDEHSEAMGWLNGIMSRFTTKLKEKDSEIEQFKQRLKEYDDVEKKQDPSKKDRQIKKDGGKK